MCADEVFSIRWSQGALSEPATTLPLPAACGHAVRSRQMSHLQNLAD